MAETALQKPIALRGAKGDKGDTGLPGSNKRVIAFTVVNPSANYSYVPLIRLTEDLVIQKVSAYPIPNSYTVTLNFKETTHPPSGGGTNVFASDITVSSSATEFTSFYNADLSAGNWLVLCISAVSNTVIQSLSVSIDCILSA